MPSESIFYDPTGRRRRILARAVFLLALLVAASSTLFAISLLLVPLLPHIPGALASRAASRRPELPQIPDRKARLSRFLLHQSRLALWKEIAHARQARQKKVKSAAKTAGQKGPIVAAFYATWRHRDGIPSLRANADNLTHLIPEWLHLKKDGQTLDAQDWNPAQHPDNATVVKIAREHDVRIIPILNNADGGKWDGERAHLLLNDPERQEVLAASLRDWLLRNKFQGVNLDLENLRRADYARLPDLLRALGEALHPSGLSVSLEVEAGDHGAPLAEVAPLCDFLVLMAYDEHYSSGEKGPIASIGWYYGVLDHALKQVPAEKLVVGLGNYAYDWTEGRKGADSLTYQGALILAKKYQPGTSMEHAVDFDPDALNPTFNYTDDAGKAHEVWMLDAVTAYNQWLLAQRSHVGGAALWVLGAEDPATWNFLDRQVIGKPPLPAGLETASFPYEVEHVGEGEILTVLSTPQEGRRTFTADRRTGLVTDMQYEEFPSSYVVQKSGYKADRAVALTFDDGPDPQNSPRMLDTLAQLGVKGTFFVIGEEAERYPDLVHRMWREGHEIGNHTFTHPDLGEVTERRATLEINATQRALQSILGRSTLLFRPPYDADSEPSTGPEVRPVALASRLGYVTVGETLDPHDWQLFKSPPEQGPESAAPPVRRTPKELAQEIIDDVCSNQGNVVLLHDGGGDRSATIEALKLAVPALKEGGYHFVTVSQLLGVSRDAVMPPVGRKDLLLAGVDKLVFEVVFAFETGMSLAFLTAIILAVARMLFVCVLALIAYRRERKRTFPPGFRPTVSVMIAAYNERPVIIRTIESVLRNDYPDLEIIVVDDGSRDGTGDEVEARFGNEPRVRLVRQPNGGKAAALNNAIRHATGEVLVGFDADTQIAPDTIALLARHFADPRIAAVAGNVKVGNRVNLLTCWQAIEYVTSQNLDRRAYGLLNAITVVPGAVGAWRRSAVREVGGYVTDTLAEDMDLTWRLRRAKWKIVTDSEALAFTEAPDTLPAFFKQRFRWAYGTLQCLWKHRGALGRCGWFGCLALPALWVFQVLFQLVAPLVDLQMLYVLASFVQKWVTAGLLRQDWQPLPHATHMLLQTGFFYALFFSVELAGAGIAFRLDRERPGILWWLFWQRFVYRQMMYSVVWKSVLHALRGMRSGWGKLERKGTVRMSPAGTAEAVAAEAGDPVLAGK
jgi:cellulose synthase/poly-beta-1,6-N-acetylglucosamine synthase-like glycosyltransferase/peptidoglycan/xylan/chitin deacetylase (PgdA/CDA1 family)/spore germination protein YaaH